MPLYNLNRKRLLFASQDPLSFQSVQSKRKKKNSIKETSKYPPHTYSSALAGHKAVENFRTRLFDGLFTFWQNRRLRAALITLLVIAPASKYLYLLFPESGFGEYLINWSFIQIPNTIEVADVENRGVDDWYFLNFYFYFWSVGELLAPTISIIGMFLLFPRNYYPAYLVGVPFGYYLSTLVHRAFIVNSEAAIHEGAGTIMIIIFLILGVVIFMVSDKVLFKEHHRRRASEARVIGIINMPGLSWEEKELILKKEAAEAAKHSNEVFDKEGF